MNQKVVGSIVILVGVLCITLAVLFIFSQQQYQGKTGTSKEQVATSVVMKQNEYVEVKRSSLKNYMNQTYLPYLNDYLVDTISITGIDPVLTESFELISKSYDIEVTEALKKAKTSDEKKSITAKKIITSKLKNHVLEVKLTFELTGRANRVNYLYIDVDKNEALRTSDIIQNKKKNMYQLLDYFYQVVTPAFQVPNNVLHTTVGEVSPTYYTLEQYKENKEVFIKNMEKNIDRLSYYINDMGKIVIKYKILEVTDIMQIGIIDQTMLIQTGEYQFD